MLGVKNATTEPDSPSGQRNIRGEVWFNELRLI